MKLRRFWQINSLHLPLIMFFVLFCFSLSSIYAQQDAPKKTQAQKASKYSYLPSGYNQVGTTQLYYRQRTYGIDIIGYYNGYYYSSTYADDGYKLSMKVNDNAAVSVNCINGTTSNGVTVIPSIQQQGELARICYTVANSNTEDVVFSMGTHADVMIGNNDSAPISRRIDTFGQTYGLTMKDGNGAQLCVLFGSGLAGVSPASDFWFGDYYLNSDYYQMVGSYSSGGNYMEENGNYDSGMGWCWKDRTIAAGASVVFSYVIGVGEVNLEPNSSFEVTPDDPEGWNDLSRPHRLTLNGLYESPAGLEGIIDYAVEDSEVWVALTDTLASGDEFTSSLVAMFDATKPTHIIKFRTRDVVGNTTLLPSIEYVDVSFHELSNITDKTYTGDSLYMSDLICDLDSSQYVVTNYRNNVNAGTASFDMQGVFPATIGSKTYTFAIAPQPLSGDVVIADSAYVYNGRPFTPHWQFTNTGYTGLESEKDFSVQWDNNTLPGTATLSITGVNNYTGTLSTSFNIDKAALSDELFTIVLPNEDITYDEQSHGATVYTTEGVGEAIVSYQNINTSEISTMQPTEPGDYNIHLEFAEGSLYYGRERAQIGSFSIYEFSAEEWAILQTVLPQLTAMGWSQPWDISQGMKGVSSLQGLTIEKGHVTALDLNGQNLTGMFPYAVLAFSKLQSLNLAGNNLAGDIGLPTYAFAQQNPAMMLALQEINISGNQFAGNLGIFANCFGNLNAIYASNNCLEDVYPVIPATVTTLDISEQTISRVVPLHLANLSADSIATKVPSILLYDHEAQTFIPNINLLCTTQDNNWGMMMSYRDGELTIPYISEQNIYYGANGDTLNVSVVNDYGVPVGSSFRVSLAFDEGDSNFDGEVNVLDLQSNILFIVEKYLTRPYNFTAANMWQDDIINIQDIICFVNMLINTENTIESQAAKARASVASYGNSSEATIAVVDGQLVLETTAPVAAFDITVAGANSLNVASAVEQAGITVNTKMQSNGMRIIGYSISGATIAAGTTVIGGLGNNATICDAMLSDSVAKAIGVSLNGTTTGIESIESSSSNNTDIYDIQGRKLERISNRGIHIVNGQKVMK